MTFDTNNPMTKTKASAFKALMGNKELSQNLFDSWDAPIGSTKRSKAKSVLKSVLMTSQRNAGIPDGEGGPGAMPGMYAPYGQQGAAQPQGSSSAPQQPQQSSNGMSSAYDMYTPYGSPPQAVTTPTPKPTAQPTPEAVPGQPMPPKQIKFMKTIDHLVNQKGGLNQGVTPSGAFGAMKNILGNLPKTSNDSRLGQAYNWTRDKASNLPDVGNIAKEEATGWGKFFGKTAGNIAAAPYRSYMSGVGSGLNWLLGKKDTSGKNPEFNFDSPKILGNLDTPFTNWFANRGLGDETEVNNKPIAIIKNPETGEATLEDAYETGGIEGSTDAEGNLDTGTNANTEGDASAGAGANIGSGTSAITREEEAELEGANYSAVESMTDQQKIDFYNSQTPANQAKISPLLDAVASGMGVEAWKALVETDKQIMKEIGLPKEIIDWMPKDGSLSGELLRIRDRIKEEKQLNIQADRLTSLQTQGLTLTNDVKAYIRGKDEYLGEIDDMLNKTMTLASNMDLSNPHTAKRMANYTTYLTMLKGRQTQRYMGFVNDSIDYYNQQTQAAQSKYDASARDAKAEYDDEAALTTERFNKIDTMIGDMYTNAENKTQNEREEIKWTYDLAAMEARRVKDITDSVEAVRKLEGTSVDYNKPPTPDNYAEHYLSITTDDFGELEFGTYDPYVIAYRASADKQNPETAWQKFLEYSASNIYSKTESGNFTDEINKYKNIFKGYINNAADKEVYDKFVDGWFRVKKTLSDATFEGLKEYIGDETESIKKAMRDLTGESRFNKPKTAADRASFINGQQGKIGDLAPALFDSYITQVAAGSEPEDTFSALYSLSDKDFASQLASDLSNSILTL